MTTISDYYELISDDDTIKVTFSDIGEGRTWADHAASDLLDTTLLRFDVYYRHPADNEWEPANDASYCTQVPSDTDPKVVNRLLAFIMDNVHGKVDEHGRGIKKVCEELSWISPERF